ncbi:MAG: flavin reductase family protein [Acetobacteraceae bacterium]|nr:flavin reductase family protein [Acetobacteraceae bacterium]
MRAPRDLVSQGVFIVTSAAGSQTAGMTACWVTRLSCRPAWFGVAMHHGSHTREVVLAGGCFCLNIPASDQAGLARHFGRVSGRHTDKLRGLAWRPGPTGAPVLLEVAAYIDCRLVGQVEVGDHTLLIGELVEEGVLRKARPLPFRPRDYGQGRGGRGDRGVNARGRQRPEAIDRGRTGRSGATGPGAGLAQDGRGQGDRRRKIP